MSNPPPKPANPAAPLLSVYWLNSELTNTYPAPALRDVLAYTNGVNGPPQTGVVYLMGASFLGSPESFAAPYVQLEPSLLNTLQNGDVALLQKAGVKVLLTIQGSNSGGNTMGWSTMSDTQSAAFAQWLASNVINAYGLDGVDIDDEFSSAPGTPQNLIDAVANLRAQIPGKLITKALWRDTDVFGLTASASTPYSGATMPQLLNFGSTMSYGTGAAGIESATKAYTSTSSLTYPLAASQLCAGVQAGPSNGHWMTSLADTTSVATWAKNKNYLGVMIYSFSQDIEEFTGTATDPSQYKYPYPSAGDHMFQQAVVQAWGETFTVNQQAIAGLFYPAGSFYLSSKDIQMTLSAELKTKQGTWVSATLDILALSNANITNSDGTFVQQATMLEQSQYQSIQQKMTAQGLGAFVPVGDYWSSARNVSVTLSAQCRTIAGGYQNSSLGLSTANPANTIVVNNNGALQLQAVQPVG
ncbi:EndoS/ChiA family endoglycosidase [Nitrospirillum pindoramense]|uniref:mannosyl-glycoprotein endo-beta-N-acetylglucosaminidase n=1 Tax=Nitrospirillum amazonense TaxID=28077 RepID=A0A560H3W2_9PROT|nr:glycosyl hydrolase family 18 protein [Nitrospirillum amazonense]TWB40986.1 CVNH domain-containing protein [Nitrospirillum amazonense]